MSYESFLQVSIEHVSPADLDSLERGELDEYVPLARQTYNNGWFIRVFQDEWEGSDLFKVLAPSIWEVILFARRWQDCSWVCLSEGGTLYDQRDPVAGLPIYEQQEEGVPL